MLYFRVRGNDDLHYLLQNIPSWKGPTRIHRSNPWLHTGPPKLKPSVWEHCPNVLWTLTAWDGPHSSLVKNIFVTLTDPALKQFHEVTTFPCSHHLKCHQNVFLYLSLSFHPLFSLFWPPQLYILVTPLLEAEFSIRSSQLRFFQPYLPHLLFTSSHFNLPP